MVEVLYQDRTLKRRPGGQGGALKVPSTRKVPDNVDPQPTPQSEPRAPAGRTVSIGPRGMMSDLLQGTGRDVLAAQTALAGRFNIDQSVVQGNPKAFDQVSRSVDLDRASRNDPMLRTALEDNPLLSVIAMDDAADLEVLGQSLDNYQVKYSVPQPLVPMNEVGRTIRKLAYDRTPWAERSISDPFLRGAKGIMAASALENAIESGQRAIEFQGGVFEEIYNIEDSDREEQIRVKHQERSEREFLRFLKISEELARMHPDDPEKERIRAGIEAEETGFIGAAGEWAKYYLDPRESLFEGRLTSLAAEMAPYTGMIIAQAWGAGKITAPLKLGKWATKGVLATAGAGATFTLEHQAALREAMGSLGIDPLRLTQDGFSRLLQNERFIKEVSRKASLKGLSVAGFGFLSIYANASRFLPYSVSGTAVSRGAMGFADASVRGVVTGSLEGAGEGVGGRLAYGEWDPEAIVQETIGGGMMSVPESLAYSLSTKRGAEIWRYGRTRGPELRAQRDEALEISKNVKDFLVIANRMNWSKADPATLADHIRNHLGDASRVYVSGQAISGLDDQGLEQLGIPRSLASQLAQEGGFAEFDIAELVATGSRGIESLAGLDRDIKANLGSFTYNEADLHLKSLDGEILTAVHSDLPSDAEARQRIARAGIRQTLMAEGVALGYSMQISDAASGFILDQAVKQAGEDGIPLGTWWSHNSLRYREAFASDLETREDKVADMREHARNLERNLEGLEGPELDAAQEELDEVALALGDLEVSDRQFVENRFRRSIDKVITEARRRRTVREADELLTRIEVTADNYQEVISSMGYQGDLPADFNNMTLDEQRRALEDGGMEFEGVVWDNFEGVTVAGTPEEMAFLGNALEAMSEGFEIGIDERVLLDYAEKYGINPEELTSKDIPAIMRRMGQDVMSVSRMLAAGLVAGRGTDDLPALEAERDMAPKEFRSSAAQKSRLQDHARNARIEMEGIVSELPEIRQEDAQVPERPDLPGALDIAEPEQPAVQPHRELDAALEWKPSGWTSWPKRRKSDWLALDPMQRIMSPAEISRGSEGSIPALIESHALGDQLPPGWSELSTEDKRAWLSSQMELRELSQDLGTDAEQVELPPSLGYLQSDFNRVMGQEVSQDYKDRFLDALERYKSAESQAYPRAWQEDYIIDVIGVDAPELQDQPDEVPSVAEPVAPDVPPQVTGEFPAREGVIPDAEVDVQEQVQEEIQEEVNPDPNLIEVAGEPVTDIEAPRAEADVPVIRRRPFDPVVEAEPVSESETAYRDNWERLRSFLGDSVATVQGRAGGTPALLARSGGTSAFVFDGSEVQEGLYVRASNPLRLRRGERIPVIDIPVEQAFQGDQETVRQVQQYLVEQGYDSLRADGLPGFGIIPATEWQVLQEDSLVDLSDILNRLPVEQPEIGSTDVPLGEEIVEPRFERMGIPARETTGGAGQIELQEPIQRTVEVPSVEQVPRSAREMLARHGVELVEVDPDDTGIVELFQADDQTAPDTETGTLKAIHSLSLENFETGLRNGFLTGISVDTVYDYSISESIGEVDLIFKPGVLPASPSPLPSRYDIDGNVPMDMVARAVVNPGTSQETIDKAREFGIDVMTRPDKYTAEDQNHPNALFQIRDGQVSPSPNEIMGAYNTESRVARIFEASDGTTLFHEMAHWFLRVMMARDLKGTLPGETRDAVFRMLGIRSWRGLSRAKEELFASMVEAYLYEGRIPHGAGQDFERALQGAGNAVRSEYANRKEVFARGRRYGLPENVDDEVLFIMDSILMGSRAAEVQMSQGRFVKSGTAAEDPQEGEKVKWSAVRKLLGKAEPWKFRFRRENRDRILEEARAEVVRDPLWKFISAVGDGIDIESGQRIENAPKIKSEDARGFNVPGYMLSDSGASADLLAHEYNLGTGGQMLSVLQAQSRPDGQGGFTVRTLESEVHMRAESMMDRAQGLGRIERDAMGAAREAVGSSERGSRLMNEFAEIRRDQEGGDIGFYLREINDRLERMERVQDVRLNEISDRIETLQRSQEELSRQAYLARREGRLQEAAEFKARELELFQIAQDLEDQREQARATEGLLERLEKGQVPRELAGSEMLEKARDLLRVNGRLPADRPRDEIAQDLRDWVQERNGQGVNVRIPEDALRVKDWNRATGHDSENIQYALSSLAHSAVQEGPSVKERYERMGEELAKKVDRIFTGRKEDDDLSKFWRSMRAKSDWVYLWRRKVPQFFRDLGGGSYDLVREFIKPLTDAENLEAIEKERMSRELGRISEWIKRNKGWFNGKHSFQGRNLTGNEIASLILNWTNEAGRRSLLNGSRPWLNEDFVQTVFQSLTEDQVKFLELVRDTAGLMQDRAIRLSNRTSGSNQEQVRTYALGSFQGGFYPVIPDRGLSSVLSAESDGTLDQGREFAKGAYADAYTRQGSNAQILQRGRIRLDISMLGHSMNNIIHDVTHREALNHVQKLLETKAMEEAITEYKGPQAMEMLRDWLNVLRSGRPQTDGGASWLIRASRTRFSVYALALNFKTLESQLLGFFQGSSRVGLGRMIQALTAYIARPIYWTKFVNENSTYMSKIRPGVVNRAMAARISESKGQFDSLTDKAGMYSFYPIILLDQLVSRLVWMGERWNALDEGVPQDQIDFRASLAVRESQGSGGNLDASWAERGSELSQALSQFMTAMIAIDQILVSAKQETLRRVQRGEYLGAAGYASGQLIIALIIPVFLDGLIRQDFPDDDADPDEWASWYATKVLAYLTAGTPVLRDITYSWEKDFNTEGLAIYDQIRSIFRAARTPVDLAMGDEFTVDNLEDILETAHIVRGLPRAPIIWGTSFYQYLMDDLEGPEAVDRALGVKYFDR